MKTGVRIWLAVLLLSAALAACGGGGGGSTSDNSGTSGGNSNTFAGGCATYDNGAFSGVCENLEGVPSVWQSACSSGGNVYYAAGCPVTIASASRVGSCAVNGATYMFYSNAHTASDAQNTCNYMRGTWTAN